MWAARSCQEKVLRRAAILLDWYIEFLVLAMPVNRAGPAGAPSLPILMLPFVELVLCSVPGTTSIDVLSFDSHRIPRW